MGRPPIPDEIKRARGTYRPGRANPNVLSVCEHASRRLQIAKNLLDPEAYDAYAEAIHHVEFRTPHCEGGTHGMPSIDAIAEIEIVEGAVDAMFKAYGVSEEARRALSLNSSRLYRLILAQQAQGI